MSFGILTLATQDDYLKAIGLALSLKVSNPGIPLAVACNPPHLKPLLAPHFDFVIDQRADVRGFAQKVYLDHYSPFEKTLFLDSDIFVFKPVAPFIQSWGDVPYVATGRYVTGGFSTFGFDRDALLHRMGWERMVHIDGAGHAYFCKPACKAIFDRAREITAHYKEIAGNARYADEDVMNIVLTEFNVVPPPRHPFFSRYLSAKRGTLEMDASLGKCYFIQAGSNLKGLPSQPCIMHFASNEAPLAYTFQLYKLFSKFGLPTMVLLKFGSKLFWKRHIKLPVHLCLRKLGLR